MKLRRSLMSGILVGTLLIHPLPAVAEQPVVHTQQQEQSTQITSSELSSTEEGSIAQQVAEGLSLIIGVGGIIVALAGLVAGIGKIIQ